MIHLRFGRHYSSSRGFSLVELAVVMGVISSILGAIWYVAEIVRENSRIAQAMNEIQIVTQNMTSMLQGGYGTSMNSYTNITPDMDTASVIPSWMITSAGTASHPWNATGFSLYWVTNSPRTYRIALYGITNAACLQVMTKATACTAGQPGCPVRVYTNYEGSSFDMTTQQLVPDSIQTLCSANTYGGQNNSLEFDYTN